MESDSTVRGQLVPHGLALASLAFNGIGAGTAPSQTVFSSGNCGPATAEEYRTQCVLQARVGLSLLASAATGVDAMGAAPFVYGRGTQEEISALCSRLMELVQLAPLESRSSMSLCLPNPATSYM